MKIIQINKFYYLKGGSEKYLFELSGMLEKNGHTVIPFAMDDSKNEPTRFKNYFIDPVDVEKFSLKNIFKMFYNYDAVFQLERLIKNEKPDLAHLHNINYQITPAIIALLKKHNIPVVQTIHDYKLISPNRQLFCAGKICEHGRKGKFYQCLFHRCVKGSFAKSLLAVAESYWNDKKYQAVDLFLAPSRFMQETCVASGIPEEKIKVLYNPIDLEKFENVSGQKGDYLLHWGRLSEEKGISTLIQSMAQVVSGTKLKIGGDGPEKEKLERLVFDLKLQDRVEFVGLKFGEELVALIAGAKAVVIPSIWLENMPMTLLEAMAMGKTVIASRIGGIPEVIEDRKNGFLFEVGNAGDLTARINALDKFDVDEIGRNARARMSDFGNEKHLEAILKIYHEVMGARVSKDQSGKYYTQRRPEMIQYIPKEARKILDVGCGSGLFGEQLKCRSNAQVWGIELNAEAAKSAGEKLDKVLSGDVSQLAADLPDDYFDCIIFNDVLEHLADPYGLLLKMKNKLSEDGVIVCSIPNVRYLINLKELLLKKQWHYADCGILDKTHLRFFTQKSIVEMFDELDFKIVKMEGINPIKSWKFPLLNFLTLGYLADTRYLEFACVVKSK